MADDLVARLRHLAGAWGDSPVTRANMEAADRIEALERVAQDAARYYKLLYAVERKWPGETRHETALRYIREREQRGADLVKCPNCNTNCGFLVVHHWSHTMKCPNCNANLAIILESAAKSNVFPLLKDNHLFRSQEELDDYERRVRERDANLDGSDAAQQATLQPSAQDVREMSVPDLEWVLANISTVLGNHGSTHGPMKALHELSNLMSAGGIHEDAYRPGFIVPPSSFPQLSALTVERAKQLAGLA